MPPRVVAEIMGAAAGENRDEGHYSRRDDLRLKSSILNDVQDSCSPDHRCDVPIRMGRGGWRAVHEKPVGLGVSVTAVPPKPSPEPLLVASLKSSR